MNLKTLARSAAWGAFVFLAAGSVPASAISLDCSSLQSGLQDVRNRYAQLISNYPMSHAFIESCMEDSDRISEDEAMARLLVCGGICLMGECIDYIEARISLETGYETIRKEMAQNNCG